MMTYTPSEMLALVRELYRRPDGSIPGNILLTSFGYTLTFLALAPAGVSTQQLNIQANGDFLITGIRHRAQLGAQTVSTKTAPEVRMLITDSGSNEQFTNSATDLENYSQNDAKPVSLPWPRLVQGKSSLSVQVTNYSTGDTYTTLDVFFSGILIRIA